MSDLKISQLDPLTTPANADLFVIVDDVGGSTPVTMKITLANALKGITIAGGLGGTTWTGTGLISTLVTTEQLRLSYDADNYFKVDVAADGQTTFTTVDNTGTNADINFIANGNVGIATAAPSEALHVTGTIKASADLDVGNDVILYDGAVLGIAGNEVITFDAAGTINFTGCTVDIDGAFTATSIGSDTGFVAGTVAVALTIANSPIGISFTNAGATTEHLIAVVDAYKGMVIETGSYSTGSADKGIILDSTNIRPVSFLFDDSGTALSGDVRAVLSRILLTVDQDSGGTTNAIRGQIKVLDDQDLNHANNVIAPITGYLELDGTANRIVTGHIACVRAALEEGASGTTTISGSSYLCGFEATLNSSRSYAETGDMAGLVINTVDGSAIWANGIFIEDDATTIGIDIGTCATGIVIGACSTTAINITAKCQDTEAGLDDAALWRHGTYDTPIAYGALTADNLILKSTHIEAAVTTNYLFGNLQKVTTTGDSTGFIHVAYNSISTGYDIANAYATRSHIALTDTCEMGETASVLGTIAVTANKTITMTGAPMLTAGLFDVHIDTGAAVEQEVACLEVRPRIYSNIAGSSAGIRINVNCSTANYLDYGLDIRSMSHNQTAAIRILATPDTDALAKGIYMEGQTSTTSVLTNALSFAGNVTNILDFDADDGASGCATTSGDAQYCQSASADSDGAIRVDVNGTPYYIPLFSAGNTTNSF